MKKPLLYISVILCLFAIGCAKNGTQSQEKSIEAQAAEAKAVGLKIVESQFNGDKSTFISYLPDTLYFIEPGENPIVVTEVLAETI